MRSFPVDGKSVLVTGAARGIGADIARRLHAKGARVSLVGLEPDLLGALADELGEQARFSTADVTDGAALEAAVRDTVAEFGGIDVVIANAGIAPPTTSVSTIAVADFERTIDVNLYGVWRTVKYALPHIIESRGHIVVVSSIYSFFNGVLNASYAVSKAGVEQLGRAMRVELAPHGVSVGVAYFGFIGTDMVETAFAQPSAALLRKAFPAFLTRPAPLDIAGAALMRGIEQRSPRIIAPGWVRPALMLRGPLGLLDRVLASNRHVRAAVELSEDDPE
jgi:NAD(P)-dependent dehydrogenase (short-subunit alcohol dehydrogenase family)